jgi:hypothetical protein
MLLAAAIIAGCGTSRTTVPDVRTPDAPQGARAVRLGHAGVRFRAPVNWADLPGQGARAGGIQSRTATVAVWRYPRSEPLPATAAALDAARARLIERIKQRDGSFQVQGDRSLRLAGARAIEVTGRATIAGLPFRVRSTHLFKRGAEVVVDAYASPADFDRVDATVFRPLLQSLRLR